MKSRYGDRQSGKSGSSAQRNNPSANTGKLAGRTGRQSAKAAAQSVTAGRKTKAAGYSLPQLDKQAAKSGLHGRPASRGTEKHSAKAGPFSANPGNQTQAGSKHPAADAARHQIALPLKSSRRKGEWLELKLPDRIANAPLGPILNQLHIPTKLAAKLLHTGGAVRQGPNLRLRLFPPEAPEFPSDWMDLNILYEDDFSLVVNKPAGIEVHPSVQGQRGTLAHAVAAYYEATGQQCRIRHIHRLDKETTGPVLYAKNELAHYVFDKAMREKEIERIYIALAEGVFENRTGVIDLPIGQDRHHSTRRRVSETGERAVTRYEVVETFGSHTLVRLRLETGRTHQIRVHLSAIGHPLAGDGMYGGKRKYISRQALHGEKLIWKHPWTGERMEAKAPMPDDLAHALRELRNESHSPSV
jgi:23S rRNA pseudouridine1911/1915/1917 synthase